MATKNKNIKTYDLETVFSEYNAYLSHTFETRAIELQSEIELLKGEISSSKDTLFELQTKFLSIQSLAKEIQKIKVLSQDKRDELEENFIKVKASYDSKNFAYQQLISEDTSLFTEEQNKKHEEKVAKAEESMNKTLARLEKMREKLELDNKNQELVASKTEEIKALQVENSSETDDTTETVEENEDKDVLDTTVLEDMISELNNEISEQETTLKSMETEMKKVSGNPVADIETFKAFLEENKLSTSHAEELFRYRHNPEKFEQLSIEEFKMRKMHPKRDAFLKKVVVPTAVTSVGIGATIGAIAGSGLVGGSEIMGFIPVSGTPGLTEMATTMTGAVAGLAATPIIIKGKNLITRTYYKLKAQSATKNIEDYNEGTDIANIRASKLIAQIQNTQHSILSSKGPKNLVLKIINRNRIHQIVNYTIDLYKIYKEIDNDETIDAKLKAEALKPIYEMLTNVEKFITNDIAEEITHAMLTCKESKKDHSHTYMIENVDIYARLKITLDRIARVNAEQNDMAKQLKNAKKTTKNIDQKKQEAYKLVTGVKPITSVLNFQTKYGEYFKVEEPILLPPAKKSTKDFTPKPETKVVATSLDLDGTIYLILEEGKEIKIPANSGVDFSKDIVTAKEGKNKYSITYADGTKQEIVKKAKVLPEVETARHVLGAILHDEKYVQSLKDEGFKANTITALKDKLTEWIQNPTQKLVMSGKVKELYNFTIQDVNANAKNEMNLEA